MSTKGKSGKIKVTVSYTTPEGKVIEKTNEFEQRLPMEEFDFATKEGFLRDFDKVERAVIRARDEMSEQLIEAIMEEINSKKTRTHRRSNKG